MFFITKSVTFRKETLKTMIPFGTLTSTDSTSVLKAQIDQIDEYGRSKVLFSEFQFLLPVFYMVIGKGLRFWD